MDRLSLPLRQLHERHARLALTLNRSEKTITWSVTALGAQFVTAADHPSRALAWRLWHFHHELLTCLSTPGVPPDNNAAERSIRPLVVGRKISQDQPRSATAPALRAGAPRTCTSPLWPPPGPAQGRNSLHDFRSLLQTRLPQV